MNYSYSLHTRPEHSQKSRVVGSIEDIVKRLTGAKRNGNKYMAFCPVHEGDGKRHSQSLSVKAEGNRILIHCFAGCQTQEICAQIGLDISDLFLSPTQTDFNETKFVAKPKVANIKEQQTKAEVVSRAATATYSYLDENGILLFECIRFKTTFSDGRTNKTFRQRRPNPKLPNDWIWNLDGTRRVLYRLPEITALQQSENKSSKLVFICEGEKDVDNLVELGLIATCNPLGAGENKWLDEFSQNLQGLHCVIIPDNDNTGLMHANRIAVSLFETAETVRILQLPELSEKGDVSDWIESGHTSKELVELAKNTSVYDPGQLLTEPKVSIPNEAAFVWTNLEPLPDELLPIPAFHESLLPDVMREFVMDVYERMRCPIEFVAAAVVIAAAAIIGNRIRIRPKRLDDWTVTPNLWGAIVGSPSKMKTPALEAGLAPLKARQALANEEFKMLAQDYEFAAMAADAERDALKQEMKKLAKAGEDLSSLRSRFDQLEINKPAPKRYVITDTTVEKLGELLQENPRGLLVFQDELTGLIRSLDQEDNATAKAFYLQSWNGYGSYTFDRITRGKTHIEKTTLSVLGGIQPGVLSSYLRSIVANGRLNDGFISRFQLLFYPNATKFKYVDRLPQKDAMEKAFGCFELLDNLEVEDNLILRFDEAAQEFFKEWLINLEQELEKSVSEHPLLVAHFAKYRSLMPSLALIFHLFDEIGLCKFSLDASSKVSLEAAERAAAWCGLLAEHARRVYGIAIRAEVKTAKAILEKIRLGKLRSPFTARDIYRNQWSGLQTSEDCTEPLRILVDYGYIVEVTQRSAASGGRPTSLYYVHPEITGTGLEEQK